ncbi:Coq4 family protein [Qipengyuania sp. XHP0207]|uniref:Coq4 family protein n=1 Tax=Qipengyuania sp. XHP0207 TaxID=3038078 RepID=UPI00241F45B2|nr:Coq4 family protein [Qipengyuania sp. XHP0207]MDG5749472.1 Coq4 family protein [Qipengyuania sp. XHP0207]
MKYPSTHAAAGEAARDGTPLRHPDRPTPKYRPLHAVRSFRELLKDKENTAVVFQIYDALPSRSFLPRVRALALSETGETLRKYEPFLPPLLDDHEALRAYPEGSVAQAYCDFMEREGLTAAGLVEESQKAGRPTYPDLIQWFGFRQRDTHDLMHVLTGYGRDALGEQCVLLFTHGQAPSQGHLLLGYAGSLHIKRLQRDSRAPVLKATREAHRTGKACPPLVGLSIRDLLAKDLREARAELNIPAPYWYTECHRIWREEGIDPYDLLAPRRQDDPITA